VPLSGHPGSPAEHRAPCVGTACSGEPHSYRDERRTVDSGRWQRFRA
jgi:hypothetical protein